MNLAEATGLNLVPEHLRLQVKHWVTDGVALAPLREQLSQPDSDLAPFLRQHAPRECWGNPSKVGMWTRLGGERGRRRMREATEELYERFRAGMLCVHQYRHRLRVIRAREGVLRCARQTKIMFQLWRMR